jgi:hypothetical protein
VGTAGSVSGTEAAVAPDHFRRVAIFSDRKGSILGAPFRGMPVRWSIENGIQLPHAPLDLIIHSSQVVFARAIFNAKQIAWGLEQAGLRYGRASDR